MMCSRRVALVYCILIDQLVKLEASEILQASFKEGSINSHRLVRAPSLKSLLREEHTPDSRERLTLKTICKKTALVLLDYMSTKTDVNNVLSMHSHQLWPPKPQEYQRCIFCIEPF